MTLSFIKPLGVALALVLFSAGLRAQDAKPAPQLGKSSIKQVITAMTLEEKAKLVVGLSARRQGPPPAPPAAPGAAPAANATPPPPPQPPMPVDEDSKLPEKVPGAAGRTHPIARLGIPSITVSDGPAGIRISPFRNNDSTKSYYATAFPVGTLLASSWDTSLVHRVGVAFGNEVREYGADILLGPGVNIHRNPLGGRNFEYFSEDPVITGNMAAAIINGIESQGVGTSIKHFAANNQETNRNSVNTIVSERALREIYLKGFEIAIKRSQPWTVMSSYNKLNGVYTSERVDLLTTVLRNEWGFKGLVMTDWGGGRDPIAQMNSGNDLIMPGNPRQSQVIVDAVNAGKISMKQLDLNVERILNIVVLSPEFRKYKVSNAPDLKAHAAVSREAASQGMVLLKNDGGALPLKVKSIALFGNTSYDLIAGGTGSGDVNKAYTVSLTEGIANAGYSIDGDLKNSYAAYLADAKSKQPKTRNFMVQAPIIPQMQVSADAIEKAAAGCDVAILTIGRNAGEGRDRKVDDDFNLTADEKSLIKNIGDAFHAKGKKLVVVLNIGGVIEVSSWRDQVDGILLAWQPGLEAGNAIADVLKGKVNPSGKLATTFPVQYADVASAKNFPGKDLPLPAGTTPNPRGGRPSEVTYEDGIYVGYRYYNTFNVKTAYDFGYGLSYTKFKFSGLKLSAPTFRGTITATVTVTNIGTVAGKEVVELYVTAPNGKVDKPAQELKAFAKTNSLVPKQSQVLSFILNAGNLASFNTASQEWIADAGAYTVKIGGSSGDIKQSAKFTLGKSIVASKVNDVLEPEVEIAGMKK